ncbi:hypothetical protein ES703_43028 [subsurface metagenome]
MGDVFDSIASFFSHFEKHGNYCEIDKEKKSVELIISGEYEQYDVLCFIDETDIFRLYIRNILKVPRGKMAYACVLANMINEEAFPTFTISTDDGDLMSGIHFPVKGCKLSRDTVKLIFGITVTHTDMYYPAFQKLINTDVNPKEALEARVAAASYLNVGPRKKE